MRIRVSVVTAVAALFLPALIGAELIDRIAATVGNQVITESQIDEDIRVAALLGGTTADWSAAARKRAANRLVDQALIRHEIDVTHFPQAGDVEGKGLLDGLKESRPDFAAALASAHLTEEVVRQHLLWQVTFLRFVAYRFRPGVQISEADLRNFYETESKDWRQQGKSVPKFEDARQDLEKLLTSRYVDQALDRWLGDQRTQTQIVFKQKQQ